MPLERTYMRRRRQQNGGVFLHKQRGIWYYRRSVNGKRKLTPIGKLSEYPTKAKAIRHHVRGCCSAIHGRENANAPPDSRRISQLP